MATTPGPLRSSRREAIPIDARAADHLRYIRETMARAAEFTAVPGWGGVAMGITAMAAAYLASRQASASAWLVVWLVEAFVAVAIAAPAADQSAPRQFPALFRAGTKISAEFCSAHCCRRAADLHSLPRRRAYRPPRSLALVVRHRHRHRRSLFRAGGPGDGFVPDVAWRRGAVCACGLGRRVHGGGLRDCARRVRLVDRPALRRLRRSYG